jgi:hypothetical protein
MRKESVALRAQVAATIGVRANGVVGTTAVGPTAIADHHPPCVTTMSRWVIKRAYPIFTPICAALSLCQIFNLYFFLFPSCLISDSDFSLYFLSVFVLLLAFSKTYMIFESHTFQGTIIPPHVFFIPSSQLRMLLFQKIHIDF